MNISSRIKQLREERQLDHSTLADRAGLSRDDLVEIEAGTRPISHDEVQALAQVFGISVDELFHSGGGGPEVDSALIPAAKLAALLDQMKKDE